ncbi:MAG: AI-2E family transporter [Gammaproteobacteria bacterium]|nr:AI-2E family transporter [Gammaproteobacteria bacterium]
MTLAAFIIVVAGMKLAQSIIVPFLLAIFVSIVSAPPLFWFEDRGVPRWIGLILVVAGIVIAAIGLTALVGSSINDFSRDVPIYKERVNQQFGGLVEWVRGTGFALPLTQQEILAYVNPSRILQLAGDVFNGFGGVLTNAFLIFLTAIFILFETASFPIKLHAIMDDPEKSLGQWRQFSENLRRYLAIKSLASLGTGAFICICLWLIGVDYPVLWGMLAFLLNYVPNIGSIIAAVPAVILAFIQLGPVPALWATGAYAVVNIVFGNIIEPRFMGRGLGLSTLVVFLSLVFWGWILGPVGMFLSVPLTMTAKIALDSNAETRWIAILLGPDRAAREEDIARHGDGAIR